jgi:hypothetical protein
MKSTKLRSYPQAALRLLKHCVIGGRVVFAGRGGEATGHVGGLDGDTWVSPTLRLAMDRCQELVGSQRSNASKLSR